MYSLQLHYTLATPMACFLYSSTEYNPILIPNDCLVYLPLWVHSPLKEKEVKQRGRTRDKQKRSQEERTGDNYIICTNTLFLDACCEPHWLCVLWARDNEPAG